MVVSRPNGRQSADIAASVGPNATWLTQRVGADSPLRPMWRAVKAGRQDRYDPINLRQADRADGRQVHMLGLRRASREAGSRVRLGSEGIAAAHSHRSVMVAAEGASAQGPVAGVPVLMRVA